MIIMQNTLLYLMAQEKTLHPMRPVIDGKSMATEPLIQTPDIFAHVNKVIIGSTLQNYSFFQSNNNI